MMGKRCKCIVPVIVIILFFILLLGSCKTQPLPEKELVVTETSGPGEEIEEGKDDMGLVSEEPAIEEVEVEKPATEEPEKQEEENIRVANPVPNQVISSPLVITGEAVGGWFFEADFPVKLLDGSGNEIAVHYATAESDWMTEDFVPFKATIEFQKPDTEIGYLVLEKDNPSGLKENDASLIIPVCFE